MDQENRFDRLIPWLILGAIALRAVVAAVTPLLDDEAFYWLWSRRLDWGYAEHPPAIAYIIFLTTWGAHGLFWVRLGPLLVGAATTYSLFLLGRELLGSRAGFIAAALFQIVPVLAGGGFVASPDAPLFLAWTLVLRFAWQALHGRPGRWTAAGLAMGLGMLSKLYIVMLGAGLAIYLLLHARAWLRRREPYQAAALAGLFFLPVLYWDATHDWSFVRLLAVGRHHTLSGWAGVQDILTRQVFGLALLVFPVFLYTLGVAWGRQRDDRFAFLFWTSLPAMVVPLTVEFIDGTAAGTWVAPAYLGLSLVVGALWNRLIAWLAGASAAVMLGSMAFLVVPGLPVPGGEDLYGWEEAAARVRQEMQALGDRAVIVAERYQAASLLAYYTRDTVPVVLVTCPNPASVWPRPEHFADADGVAALDARWTPRVKWEEHSARVEEMPPLTVTVRGRTRAFRIFRLRGLSPRASAGERASSCASERASVRAFDLTAPPAAAGHAGHQPGREIRTARGRP